MERFRDLFAVGAEQIITLTEVCEESSTIGFL